MKKFFLAVFSLLLITSSTFAEDKRDKSFYLAPKVGFGLSNYTGTVSSAFKGSISGGLAVGIKLPVLCTVEGSVLYGTSGAVLSEEIYGEDVTLTGKYINVPVVAKFFVLSGLNVYLGPQFDFVVGETLKIDDLKEPSELLDKSTISGVVGAGYEFACGLGVAFNYNFGFSEVTASDIISSAISEAKSPKNQNMSIVFSYKF